MDSGAITAQEFLFEELRDQVRVVLHYCIAPIHDCFRQESDVADLMAFMTEKGTYSDVQFFCVYVTR